MPYIKEEQREHFDKHIDKLLETIHHLGQNQKGLINYIITYLIHRYIGDSKDVSYSEINDMIGVLECCKLELYRQLSWYEDIKKETNGPVSNIDDSDFWWIKA